MARLRHWLAELILVFIGVYAAFWLTNYQERREERQRHNQILVALQQETAEEIENARRERENQVEIVNKFEGRVNAGEMPPLREFKFISGYNASDLATLLQSGGFQLLEPKTFIALRKVELIVRNGLADIAHYQKLSDEQIVPNLDQDVTFFYDPATKQLRKRFADYPAGLKRVVQFWDEYIAAETDLLRQLQSERRQSH
jgi:hypothetical protein